jgi:hypothetical protein
MLARRRSDQSHSTGIRHELTLRGWVLILTSVDGLVYLPGRHVVGRRSTKPIDAGPRVSPSSVAEQVGRGELKRIPSLTEPRKELKVVREADIAINDLELPSGLYSIAAPPRNEAHEVAGRDDETPHTRPLSAPVLKGLIVA